MDAADARIPIIGLCTASFVLARYGLLDNYQAGVSWFHIDEFRTVFPHVKARADSLYTIDRNRATCAGGTGAADLADHIAANYLRAKAAQKAPHYPC